MMGEKINKERIQSRYKMIQKGQSELSYRDCITM